MKHEIKVDETLEIWKDVINWEHKYQVSNYGRMRTKTGKGNVRVTKGRLLSLWTSAGCPYPMCRINRHTVSIHRIVALAFIPNPKNKPQINHKDSNPRNNHVSNLEWCTINENVQHGYDYGNHKKMLGEDNYNTKLNNKQVLEVVELLKKKHRKEDIAVMYNVSYMIIYDILVGKTWKHLVKENLVRYNDEIVYTEESAKKCRQAFMDNNSPNACKKVYQYNLDNKYINEFESVIEAERRTSVSRKSIRNSNNSNKPTCNYIWKIGKPLEN